MGKRHHKKNDTLSRESKLTRPPALHETKEKSKMKGILKKLIHIKKGH